MHWFVGAAAGRLPRLQHHVIISFLHANTGLGLVTFQRLCAVGTAAG